MVPYESYPLIFLIFFQRHAIFSRDWYGRLLCQIDVDMAKIFKSKFLLSYKTGKKKKSRKKTNPQK